MRYNLLKHHRRSIRLQGYDYSQQGAYFITLVTQHRECSFGAIGDDGVRLSPIGQTAHDYWRQIPVHFPNIALDEFVVMPNHLHGIIVIDGVVGVEYPGNARQGSCIQPLQKPQQPQRNTYQHVIPRSVGSIVRSYKASVTRWCRSAGYADFHWQRDYYERIIRDERTWNVSAVILPAIRSIGKRMTKTLRQSYVCYSRHYSKHNFHQRTASPPR